MMKRLMAFGLMFLISLQIVLASPPPFPLPVGGSISGLQNPEGLIVQITNSRTSKQMTALVNSYGEFLNDWANSDDNGGMLVRYQPGDSFKIEVVLCRDNPSCVRNVEYSGQPDIVVSFDLSLVGMTTTTLPTTTSTTLPCVLECKDIHDLCPNEIREECLTGDYCPDVTINYALAIIVSAVVGAGVGVKVTRYGTKTHEHRNIRGYHSPDIIHKHQPHIKGELAPKYDRVKGNDGYYKYLGG